MTEPNAPGLTANCEVYDHEIIEIEKVLEALHSRAESGAVEYAAFEIEAKDRFWDIGFVVAVNWYTTNVKGLLMPEIVIKDRTEKKDFDYDQQVREVTDDILDLGDKGVIKTDPSMPLNLEDHQH